MRRRKPVDAGGAVDLEGLGRVVREGLRERKWGELAALVPRLRGELHGLDRRVNALSREREALRRASFQTRERALQGLDAARERARRRYADALAEARFRSSQPGDLMLDVALPGLRALAVDDGLWDDVRAAIEAPARPHDAEVFESPDPVRLAEVDAELAAVDARKRAIRAVLVMIPRDVANLAPGRAATSYEVVS